MDLADYSRKLLAIAEHLHRWAGRSSRSTRSRREKVACYAEEIAATLARAAAAAAAPRGRPGRPAAARALAARVRPHRRLSRNHRRRATGTILTGESLLALKGGWNSWRPKASGRRPGARARRVPASTGSSPPKDISARSPTACAPEATDWPPKRNTMQKFTKLTGVAAPLPMRNVDTDMIIPKQFLKTIKRTGLGKSLFYELRYDQDGQGDPGLRPQQAGLPQGRDPDRGRELRLRLLARARAVGAARLRLPLRHRPGLRRHLLQQLLPERHPGRSSCRRRTSTSFWTTPAAAPTRR